MEALMSYLYLPLIALQGVDTKKIDIDISTGGSHWYASPVWIAIGIVAAIVVLLLVVLAVRGGGTTVIKE